MRYLVGGAKSTNMLYQGNRRYWLYSFALVSAFAINILIFNEELMTVIIKDIVWLCIIYGLLEFVFHPKSYLYLDFQSDRLELGFFRKRDNITIAHRNLKSIDTTMSNIVISTKDGMNYEIPLSHFHYDEVKGIKQEIFRIQEKMSDSYQLLATE